MTANALPIISSDELGRIGAAHDEAGCGCLSTDRGVLPLAAMDIDARIDGLMAHTKLRQTFVNALSVPLEARVLP